MNDYKNIIDDGCKRMQEDLKPQIFKISGDYLHSPERIIIEAACMDGVITDAVFPRIFFDVLNYVPIDAKGRKYIFKLTTYADPTFKDPLHHYEIESSLELVPDTGEVTKKGWEDFKSQIVSKKDGNPISMPEPSSFIDDQI